MPKPHIWLIRAYLMLCLLTVAAVELASFGSFEVGKINPAKFQLNALGLGLAYNSGPTGIGKESSDKQLVAQSPVKTANNKTVAPITPFSAESEFADDRNQNLVRIVRGPGAPVGVTGGAKQAGIKRVLMPLVGFMSSNVLEGSNAVDTQQVFEFAFDPSFPKPTAEQFRFYPEAAFSKSWRGDILRVQPARLERDQDYVFGLQKSDACPATAQNCDIRESTFLYALGFRTKPYERIVYGYSVQGRELAAYYFGRSSASGKRILLNGAIHGNEWRSGDLSRLVDYLIANPQELRGRNKTLVVIPVTNPDGVAADSRFNANGVDLNRNFPTLWTNCERCGRAPLSEPESLALLQLMANDKITHVLAYHAQWPPYGIVFRGNDQDPGDVYFADWVAAKTGYPAGAYPGILPGDQTVWADSVGMDAVVVESTYVQNSDWDKNFPLYLALIREF